MAKRAGAISSNRKVRSPHKTKKRMAVKSVMLAKRAAKKAKRAK